jgi:hypothetical protein
MLRKTRLDWPFFENLLDQRPIFLQHNSFRG